MRFTLTYDGPLPSKGGPSDKAAIRQQFHPQLVRLWREHPTLRQVMANRIWPVGPFSMVEHHHAYSTATTTTSMLIGTSSEKIDVCKPVPVGQAEFLPLIRESLSLKCELKILVLRQTPPGGVLDNGDIDNRLKTLFDALSVPHKGQEQSFPTTAEGPIYTLLENDRDVLGLAIDTRQLLTHEDKGDEYVRLVIDVETRITLARSYNQPFLGG